MKIKIVALLMVFNFVYPDLFAFSSFHEAGSGKSEYKARLINREIKSLIGREISFTRRAFRNMSYYIDMVRNVFDKYGLPEDLIYLPIIESAYSPRAYSRAGAVGIWQFMKGTAKMYNLKINFWVDERRDPEKSTVAAARHLLDLYRMFKDWDLVLLAYNAGAGRIKWAMKRTGKKDAWSIIRSDYLNRETRKYLPRYYASLELVKNMDMYNLRYNQNKIITIENCRKIELNYPIDLTILASRSGVSLKTLKFYNPELRRMITPPVNSYLLRVPKTSYTRVLSVCKKIPPQELLDVKEYRVSTGETIGEIAERFKTDRNLICRLNGIKNPRNIYAGEIILIPVNKRNKNIEINNYLILKKGFFTQDIEYVVKSGDSLWRIARRFRTKVEYILIENGISFDSVINPGDKIKIPVDLPFTK